MAAHGGSTSHHGETANTVGTQNLFWLRTVRVSTSSVNRAMARRLHVGALMHNFTPLSALAGGGLLGLASALMLVGTGRLAGISGILDGALSAGRGAWRWAFLVGLIAGGLAIAQVAPALVPTVQGSPVRLAVAGLLVGLGARVSGGCTSGHGICGVSRWSTRSIIATAVFMAAGFVTVALVGALGAS